MTEYEKKIRALRAQNDETSYIDNTALDNLTLADADEIDTIYSDCSGPNFTGLDYPLVLFEHLNEKYHFTRAEYAAFQIMMHSHASSEAAYVERLIESTITFLENEGYGSDAICDIFAMAASNGSGEVPEDAESDVFTDNIVQFRSKGSD